MGNETNTQKIVVAALIKKDNKFLIAKRKDDKALGGYWEFPGGKAEAGESDEAALEREILEEFNSTIIVKYEEVFLRSYQNLQEAQAGLNEYFNFYNHERPHQSLDYRTPAAVYFGK